jgi:hypothetical protein
MKNPALLLLPAALLSAARLPTGCASLRQPGGETDGAPFAEARLGEAFTGRSARVAGILRAVERRSVFTDRLHSHP